MNIVQERFGVRLNSETDYEGGLDLDDDDWIHDTNITAKIKFTANRDAILHFDPNKGTFFDVNFFCHETTQNLMLSRKKFWTKCS